MRRRFCPRHLEICQCQDHEVEELAGHNNPPELIEDPALVERTTIVWAALDDLEHEANAGTPDKSRARQASEVVRDWFLTVRASWVQGRSGHRYASPEIAGFRTGVKVSLTPG